MYQVLLVTRGIEHPTYKARKTLIKSLMGIKGILFDHVKSLDELPGDIHKFDAMVLYFHEQKVSDAALSLFGEYVSDGGGVLAIHSATASFLESRLYFEILGGRFTRHGPIEKFKLIPVAGSNLFKGIRPFTVEDERYIHDLKSGITPHFTAFEGKEVIPMVWTHLYGKGRVCYAAPGHRPETICHPDYQNILKQGLSWIIGA